MKIWQVIGFIFVSVLGTLLHFFYDWTGGSPVAALIGAVDESVWEHMKLIFYPMVLFAFIQYRKTGGKCFWWIKLAGILTALTLIPVLYYTYSGILGVTANWFNVTIFFLAAAAGFFLEARLFLRDKACKKPQWIAVLILAVLAVAFTVFTFWKPDIPLFQIP